MAHHVYTTPGFIIHSQPQSEAGKFFLVFTRELGMIGATAQGVRLSQSKLRYYTQDFYFGLYSFVRGKEVWRMTGAKEMEGLAEIKEGEGRKLFARVSSLLKRLLPGEEQNERLFDVLEKFYSFLSRNELDKEKREFLEYLTVFRILNTLGYISNASLFYDLISSLEINEEVLNDVKENKEQIVKEINNGLKESQL